MKKKCFLLLITILFLCGCTSINKEDYETIINKAIESKYKINNAYRKGYKYYAPRGLMAIRIADYNEILGSQDANYYFYIDVVSYYNRVIENYEENPNAYYSKAINYQDKFGYLEINLVSNNRYLIEIMYNYAKIEVIVEEKNINSAINNAIILLSSVEYNNEILEKTVGENVLTSKEIEFNIFETKKQESNFLEVESNNIYVEETEDPDLIK